MTAALAAVSGWPATAAAGVGRRDSGVAETVGPDDRPFAWASVTKVLTALAVWVAVEEGTTAWEVPAGPPGATVGHLLGHASGLAPDSDAILAAPGTRRIYSNRGFEVVAEHVAGRAGMSFSDYVQAGVIEALGLTGTRLRGSPAAGGSGPVVDLLRLGLELLTPTLVSAGTVAAATSVAFPGLAGVLPGFGRQDPNDWGLGVEIRDGKHPHWTGRRNSPATFGHFGRSGAFLWVDPVAGLVVGLVGDRPFGPWAASAWPALSDAVLAAYGAS
jgi:CubicO group peptidase (beta-lactamase class C family)